MCQRCALRQQSCEPSCTAWSYLIRAEIEVGQRWALRQQSKVCPCWSNVIPAEIQVIEPSALPQHSCKPLCPSSSDLIETDVEVNQC